MTLRSVQHHVELPVVTSVCGDDRFQPALLHVQWLLTSLASVFPLIRCHVRHPFTLLSIANYPSVPSLSVSSSPYIEHVHPALSIVSAMPSSVTTVIPVATIADTWPISTVLAIIECILTHAPHTMATHVSLPMSSGVATTGVGSSAPVPSVKFFIVEVCRFCFGYLRIPAGIYR